MNNLNLHPLDYLAVAAYFIVLGLLGVYTRRSRSFADYAVGGRTLPALMIFASLAATIVGPGFSVGFTNKAYQVGFQFYALSASFSLQVIVTGLFLAPRLSRLTNCHTIGDVIGSYYGQVSRILSGLISIAVCVGFTAVMGKVGGELLHLVTGWQVALCAVIITAVTAGCTFAGGLRATVAADAMQYVLFALVVPAMLWSASNAAAATALDLNSLATSLTTKALAQASWLQMIGVSVSFFLGEMLIPPYANRALGAVSSRASRIGFVAAGVFCFAWLAICAALGVTAHGVLGSGSNPDEVFLGLGSRVLPVGIFGLLLSAIVAIIMSSQESVLNASSVALVKDVLVPLFSLSEDKMLLAGKLGTLGIALFATILSMFAPSIIDGLLIIYSLWAPTVLLPLVAALIMHSVPRKAGLPSILTGGLASLGWRFLLHEPGGVPSVLPGLAAALAAYLAIALTTRTRAMVVAQPNSAQEAL